MSVSTTAARRVAEDARGHAQDTDLDDSCESASDVDTSIAPAPAPRSTRHSILLVSMIATTLAVAAVALTADLGRIWQAEVPTNWWWTVLIVGGFAAADRYAFHVEYQRQAITFTMSEIPTVFALIYLGPVVAIATRVVVGIGLIVSRAHPPLYKNVFNGALFAFEMALAFSLLSMWTGWAGRSESMLVIGAVGAVALSCTIGSSLVLVAIACFENGLLSRLRSELPIVTATTLVGAVVGATALAPTFVSHWFVGLSVLPIASVWVTTLRHRRLVQSHRDLAAIHEFAAAIGRSLDIDEMADTALEHVRSSLRAESAAIVLDGTTGRAESVWTSGIDDADAHRIRSDAGTSRRSGGDALTASLHNGSGVRGSLIVAGREGVTEVYTESDADRLEALATQLAAALDNATTHAQMEHDALHDELTDDWNRSAFDRLVRERLLDTPRCAATMMIDLDNFKEVNETLGHHVGDDVLREFARRLRELVGDDDILARFGGDEWALYAERSDETHIRQLADAVLAESYKAIRLDDLDVVVTTSVGIAMVSEHDVDSGSLLRRADIAMYTAKSRRAGHETYHEDIDRRTPERLSLLGDLRRTLDEQLLEVHYQPKIALGSSEIVGAEALVRWNHPTRGWIRPDEFIPLAEDSGLIRILTDQVLSHALTAAKGWHEMGHEISVSVNLSTLDLLDGDLVNRVASHLERHGLAAHHLTLEITESSLMVETPRVMSTIDELDALGVALSLDDFGTGFSSLSYLRRLPVTELKIDRSFVSNLLLDQQDEVIVTSTIDLGHNLGLTVVAEGIENDWVNGRLRDLGCDLGQGYGIARPLPPERFEMWMETWELCGPEPTDELASVVPLNVIGS